MLRWLHAQAYGRLRLPIYAGLAERDELLAEIRQRTGLSAEPVYEAPTLEPQV